MEPTLRIGVLALQGAFREHAQMLRRLGADAVEVRLPEELNGLDGLVIPGGESTTIMRLARIYGLDEAIRRHRGAILGTCAGMIMLDREHLGLADLEVERNAYGRQVRSFEADVELAGDERPLRGVFIRAPRIRRAGPDVEVLGELDGEPVLVRDGRLLLATFHPELTDDERVHRLFLELVRAAPQVRDAWPASVPRGNGARARAPEESEVQRRERGGAPLRPAGAAQSGN
jgi:pyridoxal 5'-phosphate synthase pdxT subunit